MNKQWMALLLSAGMAVTTCPVPGAQEPPAEQIHTEQAEESSAAVHSDDSDSIRLNHKMTDDSLLQNDRREITSALFLFIFFFRI